MELVLNDDDIRKAIDDYVKQQTGKSFISDSLRYKVTRGNGLDVGAIEISLELESSDRKIDLALYR